MITTMIMMGLRLLGVGLRRSRELEKKLSTGTV